MSYTPKQLKAIAWFCEREAATPQLSAWPNIRVQKKDGTILENPISVLTDWYTNHKEQEKRERAAQRREEAKAKKVTTVPRMVIEKNWEYEK